jgi:hypothetical protein
MLSKLCTRLAKLLPAVSAGEFDVVVDCCLIVAHSYIGLWVGDCFVFINKQHRLNYYVGGELFNIAHLEKQKFLLGYLAKEGRVYLADKDMNVVSYKLETVPRAAPTHSLLILSHKN